MSQLKYCQGPKCHTYMTKDRKRGPKDNKRNETRRRSSFYYLAGNACSMQCQADWFHKFGNMALDHFGRIHEPKRTGCDSAWYKDYTWQSNNNHQHYFINDLLGERRPISQAQYNDENFTSPN